VQGLATSWHSVCHSQAAKQLKIFKTVYRGLLKLLTPNPKIKLSKSEPDSIPELSATVCRYILFVPLPPLVKKAESEGELGERRSFWRIFNPDN
jgi:hypothetical protein